MTVRPPEHAKRAETLKEQQEATRLQLQHLMTLSPEERLGPKGGVSAWKANVADLIQMLRQFKTLLERLERPTKIRTPGQTYPPRKVPQRRGREIRVTIRPPPGVTGVDICVWKVPKSGGEPRPTKMNIAVDGDGLAKLIDALKAARQHV